MKIRNGFVSNSSSSSFIVAVDKKKKGKVTLMVEVDLKDYAGKSIKTVKDLKDYMEYNYCWSENKENESLNKIYEQSKKAIENGKEVYFGLCADDGDGIEQMLCVDGFENFAGDGIEVIQGKGGY